VVQSVLHRPPTSVLGYSSAFLSGLRFPLSALSRFPSIRIRHSAFRNLQARVIEPANLADLIAAKAAGIAANYATPADNR
jgi:hypothetical protein